MKGILIDDSGNLIVKKGTLEIGDTKVQDAALLIGAFTGEFKHAPMLGGNVKKIINGKMDPFWISNMKAQLKAIGLQVKDLRVTETGVELELIN